MTSKKLRFLLFVFVLTFAFSSQDSAQTKQSETRLPCERGEKLLRSEENTIVTFAHNQLKDIAVEQVAPKFPRSCRCLGVIRVKILIDAKGKVKCFNTTEGNPLLRASAMQAAKKWTFKPTTMNDKAVSVRGELVFEFSSDGKVTY